MNPYVLQVTTSTHYHLPVSAIVLIAVIAAIGLAMSIGNVCLYHLTRKPRTKSRIIYVIGLTVLPATFVLAVSTVFITSDQSREATEWARSQPAIVWATQIGPDKTFGPAQVPTGETQGLFHSDRQQETTIIRPGLTNCTLRRDSSVETHADAQFYTLTCGGQPMKPSTNHISRP